MSAETSMFDERPSLRVRADAYGGDPTEWITIPVSEPTAQMRDECPVWADALDRIRNGEFEPDPACVRCGEPRVGGVDDKGVCFGCRNEGES